MRRGSIGGVRTWSTRGVLALTMALGLGVVMPAGVPADAAPAVAVASIPADGAAEQAIARRTGRPVAVEALSTATTKVTALPTGAFRAAITPTRVHRRGSVSASGPLFGWTGVWRHLPTRAFWQNELALGAGYGGPQRDVVRSYFRFDVRAIRGKRILGAELNLRQIDAASCKPHRTYVFRTGNVSAATTWNHQPTRHASQSYSTSTTGCGTEKGMVGWDVTEGATSFAAGTASTGTFLVRAQYERDAAAWKRYDDDYAGFYVTYVSAPETPTDIRLRGGSAAYPCGTVEQPVAVGSTQLTVGAVLRSADAGSAALTGMFERRDLALAAEEPVKEGTSVPSGLTSTLSWTVADGHVYRFRVKNRVTWSYDGVEDSWDSAYSPWCYFRIDL